jgi:C4-type Zn-finger protein
MSGILETLKFLGSSWLEVAVAVDKQLETQAARIATLEAALQARVTELEGVLLEARDDLTEWIDVAHQHREKYPHIMQDFENDMEIVRRIDAALEGKKDE